MAVQYVGARVTQVMRVEISLFSKNEISGPESGHNLEISADLKSYILRYQKGRESFAQRSFVPMRKPPISDKAKTGRRS